MKRFLYQNAFQMLISALLTLLLGIGFYYAREVESCEKRIWKIETETPAMDERIKANETRLTDHASNLEKRIEEMDKHLSEKMDQQYQHIMQLIESLNCFNKGKSP